MYDKPKVTIDLAEYMDLKQKAAENMAMANMEVGQTVLITPMGGTPNHYRVSQRMVNGRRVDYILNDGRLQISLLQNTD